MNPRGGKFFPGAPFTDQNDRSRGAGDTGKLLLKKEKAFAYSNRFAGTR